MSGSRYGAAVDREGQSARDTRNDNTRSDQTWTDGDFQRNRQTTAGDSQPNRTTRGDRQPRRSPTEPVVRAENLTKTYGSGDETVTAVDGVDLEIERGTVVGLLGPNGAGKTTIIKVLLGLITPDSGRVRVDGVDVTDSPRAAYRSVNAMLEGARNVYWRLTVRENLRFFARLADRPADTDRIDELIEQVGLADKADVTVNELSRGMKQKTSLACTLIRETPIAFLDEPTLGLDVESSVELRQELRRLVERENRTIVLSSHDMDVIEAVCDRVLIMNDGQIVADESVEDLYELFRTQAYRLTVDRRPADEYRRRLAEQFGAENWVQNGDEWQFDATHVQGEAFHDLLTLVRESEATFVAVDAIEPDLEEIFLHVVDGDDSRRTDGGNDDGNRQMDGSGSTGSQRADATDGDERRPTNGGDVA